MSNVGGAEWAQSGRGHEIPGFENLTRIGSGGSSTVYRALDVRHQRHVAVKVLDAQTATGPRRTAFQREIEAIGRIGNHPHVVTILGSGFTADSHPYLVLPLFERGTYSELVDEHGPLTWAEAVDIGIKLASAVETVHRAGVVHRDIKPGNVFVGVTPAQPLLADFGISSTVGGEQTKTQTMAVTFGYTAPEVLDDQRPTPASDIYSLGMTIFRLIQGLHAYYAETPAAVMRKVLAESDRPQLSAGVPPDLAEVVAGALARNPAKRPPSALELARRLQRVQLEHDLPVTGVIIADEPALTDIGPVSEPTVSTVSTVSTAEPVAEPVPPQSAEAIEASMLDALLSGHQPVTRAAAEADDPPATTPTRGAGNHVDVAAILAAAIGPQADSSDGAGTNRQAEARTDPVEPDAAADKKRNVPLDLPTVVTPRQPRSVLQNLQPEPEPQRWYRRLGRRKAKRRR